MYYNKGTCGACIKRCPANALSKEGHNKWKCHRRVYVVTEKNLGLHSAVCVKLMCHVNIEIPQYILPANQILETKNEAVDFYADWCGPCKMLSPILEEIASELGEKVKVGKLNVDESNDLAFEYEVMSIPTLILFENGKEISRIGHGERLTPKQILDWYQRTLN